MGRTVPDVHTLVAARPVRGLSPRHCCDLARARGQRTHCGPGSCASGAGGAVAFAVGCVDGGGPVPMRRRLRSSRLAVLIASVVIGSLLLITGHLDGFKLVATTSAGSEVLQNPAGAGAHTHPSTSSTFLHHACTHTNCAMHSEPCAHCCNQLR